MLNNVSFLYKMKEEFYLLYRKYNVTKQSQINSHAGYFNFKEWVEERTISWKNVSFDKIPSKRLTYSVKI